MKRTLYILFAAFAIIACGDKIDPDNQGGNSGNTENSGGNENNGGNSGNNGGNGNQGTTEPTVTLASKITGEWHSTSLPVTGDVYISLAEGGAFELYQKIGDGGYRLYRGTWKVDENKAILSGKYNDGNAWAASYSVSIDKDVLTLTSENEAKEKSTYKKVSIPAEVKENCVVVVKSAGSVNAPLL